MKIESINSHSQATNNGKNKNNPNFKSLGMSVLGVTGALMQGIENKGYFASFLIQDGLGMTLPRVITGFHRDKEVTGEYNYKEGFEVLGREGLTGPFMISVAPLLLWLTGKFCKSAGTNTRLIKIIGKNFKEFVSKNDKNIKTSKDKFKNEFYKYNIEQFYKKSVPNDKKSKETIDYIMKEFEKFCSKDGKIEKDGYKNILNKINEKMSETSSDLDGICKLKADFDGKEKVFTAGDVLKAIREFGYDAIEKNPEWANIDTVAAENIKNNLAARRMALNIGGIVTTLGGLSVLPKIYARNKVAPGAQHLIKQKEEQQADSTKTNANQKSVSFHGKGINSEGVLAKIGKFLTKKVPDWFQQEFEYNGYNFTASMMACLSLFGLLLPRGLRAYNRAYVDENGKRDMSEIHEILLRDSISSLAVVYTVPILQKCLVSSYENNKGFILTNKASMNKSKWKKFIDVINPYSQLKVLTNTELEALYGNINTKEKFLNFANYVNKKGGDLYKILSKSTNASSVFNKETLTLESLKEKSREKRNSEIIEMFEKLPKGSKADETVCKLMKDAGEKQSSITKMARGLNSVPGFIVTVVISPIILGVLIPLLTYSNTRKSHEKMFGKVDDKNKINQSA